MTRKTLGHVELEWTCKRCGTVNPGLQKTCTNCGAPMGAEDQFELPEEQKLISEAEKLAAVPKGPDIHCPYCGARNPAGTVECVQCGGNLAEGAQRQAGQVLGAHRDMPAAEVVCPFCESKIPANSQRCPNCGGDLAPKPVKPAEAPRAAAGMPKWMMILGAVALVLCCAAAAVFAALSLRTEEVVGRVEDVSWERSIEILEQRLVEKGDWDENIPAEAQNVTCQDRHRETRDSPAPNSVEVCGTPYTVDTGSGVGEVVQDCVYEVYDSYCEYEVLQWAVVNQTSAAGVDLQPYWPDLSLTSVQRQGDGHETYSVFFNADGKRYTYSPGDAGEFSQYQPGSEWTLQVNAFGSVTSVEP
jgi:DNA-directed RNA polymerase subunit RPC12/RpoP